jgi:hypothetical protein
MILSEPFLSGSLFCYFLLKKLQNLLTKRKSFGIMYDVVGILPYTTYL